MHTGWEMHGKIGGLEISQIVSERYQMPNTKLEAESVKEIREISDARYQTERYQMAQLSHMHYLAISHVCPISGAVLPALLGLDLPQDAK